MAFNGFSKETLTFLAQLTQHNNKEWFADHKDEYKKHYVQPALAFIDALGPKLKKITPGINFEAKINKSLFRINRDTRFSKDKIPYKAHIDFWFWYGEKRGWETPSFFMRIQKDKVILGAGMHTFKKLATHYYHGVVRNESGHQLEKLVKSFKRDFSYLIAGGNRKTVARGFDKNHERNELLLHDGLTVMHEVQLPDEIYSASFVEYCLAHFAAMQPLNEWLLQNISSNCFK